jgi:hypothetical protein
MATKSKTKRTLQRHAAQRACSRFEFEFNNHVYDCACLAIRKQQDIGDCKLIQHLETQSNNRTLWLMEIKGVEVIAAYDKSRKAIATFMPKDFKPELMEGL